MTPSAGEELVVSEPALRRSGGRRLVVVLTAMAACLAVGWLAARPEGPPRPPEGAWTVVPHTGLGAWVDVYDWTLEFTDGRPAVRRADIDAMHDLGIQTVYIQTAHRSSQAAGVIEPERLSELVDAAHGHGMHVVAWYLPSLRDPADDLRRLLASAELPVGGLAVDIESIDVADPTERNRRLLQLGEDLRTAMGPDRALAAITPSAVHVQVVNVDYWPGFPWPQVADTYDAILPMTYWSIRSPEWRNGERYVGENLDRIRASTGRADIPIVPIGGIADGTATAEVIGMVRAIEARDAPGGSLYDWATSTPAQWAAMAPLAERRAEVSEG